MADFPPDTCSLAISNSELDTPKKITLVGLFETHDVLSSVLQFLHDKYGDLPLLFVCRNLQKFLRSVRKHQPIETKISAMLESAKLAEWACDHAALSFSWKCTFFSVECGYVETLQWLLCKGVSFQRLHACEWAARCGQLRMLKHLRAMDPPCPWNALVCAAAAAQGHLPLLRWVHEQACPWDARTCALAALNGHLDILKYARAQPVHCPWTDEVDLVAMFYRFLDLTESD
jgi:hypothetical protein